MKFSFEVGQSERNVIEYEFNQLLGCLTIKANDKAIKRNVRWFSEPIKEVHSFVVGQRERIAVRIEKHRMLLYGQVTVVFVNDRLYQRYQGV